jgi:hypothetical protein
MKGQERRMRRQTTTSDEPITSMESLNVQSSVTSRFAVTTVTCFMTSVESVFRAALFNLRLPEAALISNFTITIDGVTSVAQVLSRADAQNLFIEAVELLVSEHLNRHPMTSLEGDNDVNFTLQVSVSAEAKVEFMLTFQEDGRYSHAIHVQPQAVIADFVVNLRVSRSSTPQRLAHCSRAG